jgi:hypothetical protein
MAYFHREYAYSVAGIEYADKSMALTKDNLAILNVPARLIQADFLEYDGAGEAFDIVFSGGFVEHFGDVQRVVGKLCSLARHYVVTSVPSFCGINWLIRKITRPGIFCTHQVISHRFLRDAHERAGFSTLFCNYTEGLQFTVPAGKGRAFFEKHRGLSRVINLPFRTFNRISTGSSALVGWYPRTRWLSNILLYIGRRP